MAGDRRNDVVELAPVDQLLMGKALPVEFLDPGAQRRQFLLGLGDLDLAVALEAAIVVDQVADAVPDLHRGDRQRHLGKVAAETAHAAGIDARRVAPDMVLLDDGHPRAASRQMQRRR